jgi:hypothetical protein
MRINPLPWVQDKNLHVFGRAVLLRRPRIQGRAAALPCQEGEDSFMRLVAKGGRCGLS